MAAVARRQAAGNHVCAVQRVGTAFVQVTLGTLERRRSNLAVLDLVLSRNFGHHFVEPAHSEYPRHTVQIVSQVKLRSAVNFVSRLPPPTSVRMDAAEESLGSSSSAQMLQVPQRR
eukprot:3715615-Pleurochrysis_carterae.AAC.1